MNRRRPEAFKLRVYMDAIKDARNTTDKDWMDRWVAGCNAETQWISRATWISYLEQCALWEADKLTDTSEYREAA